MNQFLFWVFFSSGLLSTLLCWVLFIVKKKISLSSRFEQFFLGSSLLMSMSAIFISFREIFRAENWASFVILLFLVLVILSGVVNQFSASSSLNQRSSNRFSSLLSSLLFMLYGLSLAYFAIRDQHYFLFLFSFLAISIPLAGWYRTIRIKTQEDWRLKQASDKLWSGVAITIAFLAFGLNPIFVSNGINLPNWIYVFIPILGLISILFKKNRKSRDRVV